MAFDELIAPQVPADRPIQHGAMFEQVFSYDYDTLPELVNKLIGAFGRARTDLTEYGNDPENASAALKSLLDGTSIDVDDLLRRQWYVFKVAERNSGQAIMFSFMERWPEFPRQAVIICGVRLDGSFQVSEIDLQDDLSTSGLMQQAKKQISQVTKDLDSVAIGVISPTIN